MFVYKLANFSKYLCVKCHVHVQVPGICSSRKSLLCKTCIRREGGRRGGREKGENNDKGWKRGSDTEVYMEVRREEVVCNNIIMISAALLHSCMSPFPPFLFSLSPSHSFPSPTLPPPPSNQWNPNCHGERAIGSHYHMKYIPLPPVVSTWMFTSSI